MLIIRAITTLVRWSHLYHFLIGWSQCNCLSCVGSVCSIRISFFLILMINNLCNHIIRRSLKWKKISIIVRRSQIFLNFYKTTCLLLKQCLSKNISTTFFLFLNGNLNIFNSQLFFHFILRIMRNMWRGSLIPGSWFLEESY